MPDRETITGRKCASLVIPGRNCAATIRQCLHAVTPILADPQSALAEIIFVDDGSTDDSAALAAASGARVLSGPCGGPGAARNIGWRAAAHPLVWFIDSDCVARIDALSRLVAHMSPGVGGVGGSYDNLEPDSMLAWLIHEEISLRHSKMRADVDFLGGFNVLYRRDVLERVGGFDERLFNGPGKPGAEDAELSYRVHAAGFRLRFENRSRVGHFHPTRLGRYLRSQRIHGYWRVNLHLHHARQGGGDSYSSLVDHMQPPLAALSIPLFALLVFHGFWWTAMLAPLLLAVAQFPLAASLVKRTGRWWALAFIPFGWMRAYARAAGMLQAVLHRLSGRRRTVHQGATPGTNS